MAKQYAPKVIAALAALRDFAKYEDSPVDHAIEVLDNAGVFAALDEQTDYASAEEILEGIKADPCGRYCSNIGHAH